MQGKISELLLSVHHTTPVKDKILGAGGVGMSGFLLWFSTKDIDFWQKAGATGVAVLTMASIVAHLFFSWRRWKREEEKHKMELTKFSLEEKKWRK